MSEPVTPKTIEVVVKLSDGHVIEGRLATERAFDIGFACEREMQDGIPVLGKTPRWGIAINGPGSITMYDDVLEYETVTGNLRMGLLEENERLRATLALIDGRGCQHYTGGGHHCFENGRTLNAEFGFERPCLPCVAHRGLVP